MKSLFKPFAAVLCLTGLIASPVFAATTTTTQTATPRTSANTSQMSGKDLARIIGESHDYLPFDLDVPGQAFVSSGPYIGLPLQFAGDNLIVNSPSVNLDVRLLEIRKSILRQLSVLNTESAKGPEHSHLLLSGVIEGQVGYIDNSNPGNGGYPITYIDLSNVSVDFTIFGPSDWLTGFIEMSMDPVPAVYSVYTSTSFYTPYNSRVFVNKAFITVGDFAQSPIYGTLGQYYVPYGVYSSYMVSEPLTKLIGRTKGRAILMGFQGQDRPAWYGSIFAFRGDSHASSATKINNGGINLGYKYKVGLLTGNLGASVIANLADSGGLQIGNNFQTHEQIVHRVPGYNIRGTMSVGDHFDMLAEFISATERFDAFDMSYQGHGAKPWAVDAEASYSFTILDDKPSAVGAGYSHSAQSLALGIPQNRYYVVFNTSLLRNTLQAIEFRHDIEYASGQVATTAGAVAAAAESGRSDNAVTAQFDLFF